jgi:3-methyladenine DNA glycosylase/8-oxoguanine DNA glycosylase
MAEFAANYFGAHGGYAQQYLFHHARMTAKRKLRTHSIDECHQTRMTKPE